MTAKSRYWDHERCAWVTYAAPAAPASLPLSAELAESMPEQRADDETTPAHPAIS
jgi:hypothetical protein